MNMRIPVINLSSLSKQSGAEIESMIEHLEMRGRFVASFSGESKLWRRMPLRRTLSVRMQVQ